MKTNWKSSELRHSAFGNLGTAGRNVKIRAELHKKQLRKKRLPRFLDVDKIPGFRDGNWLSSAQ